MTSALHVAPSGQSSQVATPVPAVARHSGLSDTDQVYVRGLTWHSEILGALDALSAGLAASCSIRQIGSPADRLACCTIGVGRAGFAGARIS